MKKNEFKKLLKKEKHHLMQGKIYEIIFVTIFILLCVIMLILQNKNLLPSSKGLSYIIFIILIALPYIIIDIKRDILIKKMYNNYQNNNKILEVKDNSKLLRIILITEIIITSILGGYIITQYAFEKVPKEVNMLQEKTIKTNKGQIIKLKKYSFDQDNFSLLIPTDFNIMDQELINKKYPNGNPPTYVLSNDRTTINLALGITTTPIKNSQIKNYIKSMEMQLSSSVNILGTRFFERNNHEIGEIKFISKAIDTDIYNHMLVFSDNDYLRIVSFNCTKELQEEWQEIADDILNSLVFN